MKHELTIEALVEPGNELMVRIVQTLRTMPVPPEHFVWSVTPEFLEVRIWITIAATEAMLLELLAGIGRVPGVLRISRYSPGAGIKERLNGLEHDRPRRSG